MLVLSCREDEKIFVGEIPVTVLEIRSDKVRLGIEADKSVPVDREKIRRAKTKKATTMNLCTHTVSVKCSFGEMFIADIEQEYAINDDGITPGETICVGLEIIDRNVHRQAFEFTAKAGLECQFAESIAALCWRVWSSRIMDACFKHAQDNKRFCRSAG